MLEALLAFAERHAEKIDPFGYGQPNIRYAIHLDQNGTPEGDGIVDLKSTDNPFGVKMIVPAITRTSGVRPQLLADQFQYTFGLEASDRYDPTSRSPTVPTRRDRERADKAHQEYLALLERCVEATKSTPVRAILGFLCGRSRGALRLPVDLDPKGLTVLLVDGHNPTDLTSVRRFWATEIAPMFSGGHGISAATGQREELARRYPTRVKGLPGGDTALASANEDVYESYGLRESLNSPLSLDAAHRIVGAINVLLRDDQRSLRIDDTRIVFWETGDRPFNPKTFLDDPQPEDVRELLESVHHGHRAPQVASADFHALTLRANLARLAVLSALDTTVDDAAAALADWFDDQAIAGASPFGIWRLLRCTVRRSQPGQDRTAPPPRFAPALVDAALARRSIPSDLLAAAIRRAHLDEPDRFWGPVPPVRAALIRLCLRRAPGSGKESPMPDLDPDNRNPAYLCGRLLSVLDSIQYQALGSVNTPVGAKYFATASTAPAAVFGNLLARSRAHLADLQRNQPGAYVNLERRLGDILSQLDTFPRTLSLADQGLFALGFYHQRHHDFEAARTHKNSAA
jgi:CRISPR-associated protein Csd1